MAEETLPTKPTVRSLKEELKESLRLLQEDFKGLKHFVAEIAPEGVPAAILVSKEDLQDLLAATLEIRDAADNIVFEACVIKDKLERLGRETV